MYALIPLGACAALLLLARWLDRQEQADSVEAMDHIRYDCGWDPGIYDEAAEEATRALVRDTARTLRRQPRAPFLTRCMEETDGDRGE